MRNPSRKKPLPYDNIEKRQAKAVRFARDFLHDDALSDELESLSVAEYADRRGIPIANPGGRGVNVMARANPTRESYDDVVSERDEAVDLLQDAQEQLDDLQDRIDDLLSGCEPEEDQESDNGGDNS
jgi:hypothetical protein